MLRGQITKILRGQLTKMLRAQITKIYEHIQYNKRAQITKNV